MHLRNRGAVDLSALAFGWRTEVMVAVESFEGLLVGHYGFDKAWQIAVLAFAETN
jgi:hypothetical protein